MGHQLTKQGVKSCENKIKATVDMPPPKDRQELMRLLGMATYLAKFVPNFSEVTAKLRAAAEGDAEGSSTGTHHTVPYCV